MKTGGMVQIASMNINAKHDSYPKNDIISLIDSNLMNDGNSRAGSNRYYVINQNNDSNLPSDVNFLIGSNGLHDVIILLGSNKNIVEYHNIISTY